MEALRRFVPKVWPEDADSVTVTSFRCLNIIWLIMAAFLSSCPIILEVWVRRILCPDGSLGHYLKGLDAHLVRYNMWEGGRETTHLTI